MLKEYSISLKKMPKTKNVRYIETGLSGRETKLKADS